MEKFEFADLHCHPNLKAFGNSFSKNGTLNPKASMWYQKRPTFGTNLIRKLTGLTKFSQSDLLTMIQGNVKIAFVSFYPFEKGFFTNQYLPDYWSAYLANLITSISYNRVRYLQQHSDYFYDLMKEYEFVLNSQREFIKDSDRYSWGFANDNRSINNSIRRKNHISIIPTIEGAHVFNSGLSRFGRQLDRSEIFENIGKVKDLKHKPFFITFAHNFNNDFCGHAQSLKVLGNLVDQNLNLNSGFSKLGKEVICELLDDNEGSRILIDLKHMSLKSRIEYYQLLQTNYNNEIPLIVSHGAVTGISMKGKSQSTINSKMFVQDSINFYDEEIVQLARFGGLFAIQLDAKRLAPLRELKKQNSNRNESLHSAQIVWRQIRHVAEILDRHNLSAWDNCCIGSDFDGTIKPLNNVLTSLDFNNLANQLYILATNYLEGPNALRIPENKYIDPKMLISKFTIGNTLNFINQNYHYPKLSNSEIYNAVKKEFKEIQY